MSKTLGNICKILDNPYKHVLEFGTWSGESMLTIRNNLSTEYKLFGFDSFLGLPEDWEGTQYKKGDFGLGGVIPDELKNLDAKIFPGWFKDTIPEYLKEADNIALLHIDCDLYSSTIDILYSNIRKYIKSGTYIVFDEFRKINNKDHEQRAFEEWVKDFNINYKMMPTMEPFRQAIKILESDSSLFE